jgi:hypothetical protein
MESTGAPGPRERWHRGPVTSLTKKIFPTRRNAVGKLVLRKDLSVSCASRSEISGELSLLSVSQFAISTPASYLVLHL